MTHNQIAIQGMLKLDFTPEQIAQILHMTLEQVEAEIAAIEE
jgi:hypothetical protein